MKTLPLSLLAHMAGGELQGEDVVVDTVIQDTRSLQPGSLYVALRGERFDGHDFAYDAAMRGAAALLVEHAVAVELPQVVVADTQLALARIASGLQRDRGGTVVAITGSNGKTSVKTLVHSILQLAGNIYLNPGNRNNEIGLPLAVIDAPDDADFAIYEMGAGKPGDIAYLTDIVTPQVALVNNVAPAHLERMGSLLEIANTKAAVYDDLRDGGVAVVNADDAFAPYFIERAHGRRIVRVGLEGSADISARDIRADGDGSRFVLATPRGEVEVALPMPGRHNVRNALAAAAMALGAGATLEQARDGLNAVQPVAGRLVSQRLRCGAVLVDDSYNANPGSLDAAIDTLASSGDDAWLVLGDMRELGADEIALHAQAGARAKAAGIARLYTLGALSQAAADAFGDGARGFASHAQLAETLSVELRDGVRVLVKGSRGSAMDRIVKALLASDAAADKAATHKGDADAA